MFVRRFACLTICIFLMIQSNAHASAINAEGAAKLKGIFETMLANQKALTRPGESRFEYEGNVMVEEAGEYYAVTLPHARVVYPDGSKLDIGMISINASPHTRAGQWKMAVAIPTPIIMLDPKQAQATKINITAQKAVGIWDEGYENFAKLDSEYKNITIENAATGLKATIPSAKVVYDFAQGSDGKWSGPGSISITGASGEMTNRGSLKIADVRADFAMDQYDPSTMKQYREFLKSFLKDEAIQKPTPEQTSALADKLSEVLLNSSNGLKADISIAGLEVTQPAPAGKTPQTLKLQKAFLGLGASGMRTGNTSVGVRFGFNDLFSTPVPPGYEGVLPSTSNIDIALANVPLKQLSDITKNTIQGSIAQPQMAQMAAFSLLMKAPAILSQAGTYMDIKDSYIGNSEYRLNVSGQAKADIKAVNNMTADLKGRFSGLDKLLAKVKAIAANPKHAVAENAKNLASTLEMLRANGKKELGPGGEVYTYHFVMTPQGQMLMNGAPLGLGAVPAP